MPTLSHILSSAVEKLLTHPVTITGVEALGESFSLLTMLSAVSALAVLHQARHHNVSQSSAALSSRALKALEYCLSGRENRNHIRIPIEHSNREGAIDDAKHRRRRRRPSIDCEGL
jgi:hypothetical protein